jgi:hypothetical protein
VRRPVVRVTLCDATGVVLHQETRAAFNAGIRASERALGDLARGQHTTYEAGAPSRVGDTYTRRWVSPLGIIVVATIVKEATP